MEGLEIPMEYQKHSTLRGRDVRLEILKVKWAWEIRNTQGQAEGINDQKYTNLGEVVKD